MGKLIDLTGQVFGKLTVLSKTSLPYTKQAAWKCLCSCGKESVAVGYHLRKGKVISCGCAKLEYKLPPGVKESRRAAAEKIRRKTPVRRKQREEAQLRYQITDKAALAQFRRWVKKQTKPVALTEEQVLVLRQKKCHNCGNDIPRTGVCFILVNPRGPIDLSNVTPTCGVCKLLKPKAKFDPVTYAKQTLRRGWKRTPMAAIAKQKARKAIGKYECADCKQLFSDKKMELDHIIPVVDPIIGYTDLDTWIRRLFCDDSNLQYLCEDCHARKTKAENLIRKRK